MPSSIWSCQVTSKTTKGKGKGKGKEATIHLKIIPPNAIVNYEGWKVSFLKGMYNAKLPALIQVILLKGSKLTYAAKILLSLMVLAEQGKQVN